MLVSEKSEGILRLREVERESAIAYLEQGLPIIPVWLDLIHHTLSQKISLI